MAVRADPAPVEGPEGQNTDTGAIPALPPAEQRQRLLARLYQRLAAAQSAESSERIVQAIERMWLQSGSDTVDLLMHRVAVAMRAHDYDLATKLLSAVVDFAPDYAEGWNQLATIHFLQEDYEAALLKLRRVLALEPHHFKAVEGLAVILREVGDKRAALKAFRRLLELHPQQPSARQAEQELKREVEGQGI